MAAGEQPPVQRAVLDQEDAAGGVGEDRSGGEVAVEGLAAGDVVIGVEQFADGREAPLLVGMGVEVLVERFADVVGPDGQGVSSVVEVVEPGRGDGGAVGGSVPAAA
ncbi:hypothetical protein ACIRD2_12830 [Streptomyces sp. NPDC093595]|uniref:hypothetical protein n=1 Tax=Streptomyces sp. NPDC093595 TaxID=3366045 RepID=UPI00380B8E8C